jgi:predicted phosphodiesterase
MNTIAAAKRLFRIQYVSDIHLEHYEKLAFPLIVTPAARYLALAGDIGHPSKALFRSFIDYTARNWDRVFFVAGNHEYYAQRAAPQWRYVNPSHMFETQEEIKSILRTYKNVHYLHHDAPSVFLPEENVAIVGSTLWSHIPPDRMLSAAAGMNDYHLIPYLEDGAIRPLAPQDTNAIHAKERAMLEAQIDYWGSQRVQVCVITHHLPSFTVISPRFADNPLNCCFASNCEDLMKPHVRAWIYGHTHNASSASFKHTLCVANAAGYMNEGVPGFSRTAWIEFPIKLPSEESALCDELASASVGIQSPLLKFASQSAYSSRSSSPVEFM